MSQPSSSQMNALLQYAAAKLGMTPEQLARTVASGGYEHLSSSLSDSSRRTLESMVGDPARMEALLASPQVQELLKRFQ